MSFSARGWKIKNKHFSSTEFSKIEPQWINFLLLSSPNSKMYWEGGGWHTIKSRTIGRYIRGDGVSSFARPPFSMDLLINMIIPRWNYVFRAQTQKWSFQSSQWTGIPSCQIYISRRNTQHLDLLRRNLMNEWQTY